VNKDDAERILAALSELGEQNKPGGLLAEIEAFRQEATAKLNAMIATCDGIRDDIKRRKEMMSDWSDITGDIRRLLDEIDKTRFETPGVQHLFVATVNLLHSIVLRIEMLRPLGSQSSVDDLRVRTLTTRLESAEMQRQIADRDLEKRLQKGFDTSTAKLDAIEKQLALILQRLPEPPRGFED
jgi:hypothetical protein